MEHIWVLSYAQHALECWYFSSEEKAKEAKEALIATGRKEFWFNIFSSPIDKPIEP